MLRQDIYATISPYTYTGILLEYSTPTLMTRFTSISRYLEAVQGRGYIAGLFQFYHTVQLHAALTLVY